MNKALILKSQLYTVLHMVSFVSDYAPTMSIVKTKILHETEIVSLLIFNNKQRFLVDERVKFHKSV